MESNHAAIRELIGATLVRVYYFELPYDRTEGIAPARPHFHTAMPGVHTVDHCVNLLTDRGLFEIEWTADGNDRYGLRCRLNAPPGVYYEFAEIWDVTKETPWSDVAGQPVSDARFHSSETIALEFAGGRTLYIHAAEFNDDGAVEARVDNLLVADKPVL